MDRDIVNGAPRHVFEFLVVAASVNVYLYLLFYTFSSLIWSFNVNIPRQEIMWEIRWATAQNDGIESFVLYVMMFANIFFSIPMSLFFERMRRGSVLLIGIVPLLIYFYLSHTGFNPPEIQVAQNTSSVILLLITISLVILLASAMHDRYQNALTVLFALVLFPTCFVATSPISINDYAYIIDPALKILHGGSLPNIYFQYDIFMSLLAALWIKLKFDLNHFQIVGQLSYYLFILGAYLLSMRLFLNKKLSIYLIIALVILRLYANAYDPVSLPQVSSMRLDLWIIVLAMVYFFGAYHWAVGILVGILLLFSRTFGFIYLAAYVELLFVLWILDVIRNMQTQNQGTMVAVKKTFREHLSRSSKNLSIIFISLLFTGYVFRSVTNEKAAVYWKLGIGFLKISPASFYWYVPIVFSLLFVLLFYYRGKLPPHYVTSGFFLIFLAIGNSLYFFGRSHEHNIINLAGILVFVVFTLFDVINYLSSDAKETTSGHYSFHKSVIVSLPIVFIIVSSYLYSSRIIDKVGTQFNNLKRGQFIQPLAISIDDRAVKEITHESRNVYFISHWDCLYYYDGFYVPLGDASPYSAWLLKKDAVAFLQDLLDKRYYLVWDGSTDILEILPFIKYDFVARKDNYLVYWKR